MTIKGMNMPHKTAAADVMAALSATAAGVSWLQVANDVAQLGATAVAIVAGLYAIKWHKARIADLKKKVDKVYKEVKHEGEREGS